MNRPAAGTTVAPRSTSALLPHCARRRCRGWGVVSWEAFFRERTRLVLAFATGGPVMRRIDEVSLTTGNFASNQGGDGRMETRVELRVDYCRVAAAGVQGYKETHRVMSMLEHDIRQPR